MFAESTAQNHRFCTLSDTQSSSPLPSLELVAKLTQLCSSETFSINVPNQNQYDRKNHVLYVNDIELFASMVKEKEGRGMKSFEKQLRMMGFRKKVIKRSSITQKSEKEKRENPSKENLKSDKSKIQSEQDQINSTQKIELKKECLDRVKEEEHSNMSVQEDEPNRVIYAWKGNRSRIVERQLQLFEDKLSNDINTAMLINDSIERQKSLLDSKLEAILFKNLATGFQTTEEETTLNCQENKKEKIKKRSTQILDSFMGETLKHLKNLSNETQLQTKQLISNISTNLSKELDIYRVLIFKESHIIMQKDHRSEY